MPKSKTTRRMTAEYLYTDGTLVSLFDETRDGVLIGETADVTLGYCTLSIREYGQWNNGKPVHGRIVFSRTDEYFMALAKGGRIDATMPSIEAGSENTKSRGIQVSYIYLTTKQGHKLSWADISIMHSGRTIQDVSNAPDNTALSIGDRWGSARIWTVTDLRPKKPVELSTRERAAFGTREVDDQTVCAACAERETWNTCTSEVPGTLDCRGVTEVAA